MIWLARWIVIAVVALMCGSGQAHAAFVAYTIDNNTAPGSLLNPPFTLGFKFTLNDPISVTQLGVFDDAQNGLTDSYPVGLFDSNGNPLVSTTVPSGTAGSLINQFRYAAITPYPLSPGDYYIGAQYVTSNDAVNFPGDASNFQTSPSIIFLQDGFRFSGTLAAPLDTSGTTPAYFGPNFAFAQNAQVPEPSTLAMFGFGAMGLIAGAIRRWRGRR